MSRHFAGWDARTLELALRELTTGLPAAESAALRARVDARELEELELALAELAVEGLGTLEAPPAELLRRVRAAAPVSAPASAPRRDWRAASGWLVAAGLLVAFALFAWMQRSVAPADRRARLLASAGDLVRANWSATQDPLATGVSGDVVWSSAKQEGYMRFRSLAPNDPARHQYQLWIFDSTRAEWEAKPVDGGVFDVGPGEEVVVPIAAKLDVRSAKLFAVTLEDPGGVVVSKREHLLALATP